MGDLLDEPFRPPKRTWLQKFRHAFLGMRQGVHDQNSFTVHFLAAALVLVAAVVLNVDWVAWCLLLLCITIVLAAEMFNSALEHLARAIDPTENIHIARALDIGSGAVLTAALGAAVVGVIVVFRHL